MRCVAYAIAIVCVLGIAAPRLECLSVGEGKKLIQWGWGTPSIEDFAERGPELDADSPFDGVITAGSYEYPGQEKKRSAAWTWFGREKIPAEAADRWIVQFRAAGLKRMTDNFLLIVTMPGTVDWFDDFSAIIQNAKLLARVAKQGGFRGMMADFEEYGRKRGIAAFTHAAQKYSSTKTFRQYCEQVKLRGRQVGAAISSEFPDAVILITHGNSFPFDQMRGTRRLSDVAYGLLPAFIDGLMEGTSLATTFVDAYESSYGYRDHTEFRQARELIWKAVAASSNPKLYAKRMNIGFGLRMDNCHAGKERWDAKDFSKNYFTPDEFEYAAFCAQATSDRYVWIYTQQVDWWNDRDVPQEYLDALANSRKDHALRRGKRRSMMNEPGKEAVVSSKTTPGSDDESTFGNLWTDYEEVLSLPLKWGFALDPGDVGIEERWFAPGSGSTEWGEIEIGEWWEVQGYQYDGVAWYRTSFVLPERYEGRRLFLAFGAVDDGALVFVNGEKAGEWYRIARAEWGNRFLIEVTPQLRFGESNALVARVLDRHMLGGIWKSVKLIAERAGQQVGE